MAQQKQQKGQKPKEKVNYVKSTKNFFNEVMLESKKIVWPTRENMVQSTMTVLGTIAILTIFMGIADFVWGTIFNYLI